MRLRVLLCFIYIQHLTDTVIQGDLHLSHYIYITEQLRIKGFAEGPSNGSAGIELMTCQLASQHLNHCATTAHILSTNFREPGILMYQSKVIPQ